MRPLLIVFGGLPGTGKTTLARQVAKIKNAAYVRVDTIEQALRTSGEMDELATAGYLVAYGVACDILAGGISVVADSVNPIAITRDAWRDVARQTGADLFEVEVICSDASEHQRRIEERVADIVGHKLPSWADVVARTYEQWDEAHLQIDTMNRSPDVCVSEVLLVLEAQA